MPPPLSWHREVLPNSYSKPNLPKDSWVSIDSNYLILFFKLLCQLRIKLSYGLKRPENSGLNKSGCFSCVTRGRW